MQTPSGSEAKSEATLHVLASTAGVLLSAGTVQKPKSFARGKNKRVKPVYACALLKTSLA